MLFDEALHLFPHLAGVVLGEVAGGLLEAVRSLRAELRLEAVRGLAPLAERAGRARKAAGGPLAAGLGAFHGLVLRRRAELGGLVLRLRGHVAGLVLGLL